MHNLLNNQLVQARTDDAIRLAARERRASFAARVLRAGRRRPAGSSRPSLAHRIARA